MLGRPTRCTQSSDTSKRTSHHTELCSLRSRGQFGRHFEHGPRTRSMNRRTREPHPEIVYDLQRSLTHSGQPGVYCHNAEKHTKNCSNSGMYHSLLNAHKNQKEQRPCWLDIAAKLPNLRNNRNFVRKSFGIFRNSPKPNLWSFA